MSISLLLAGAALVADPPAPPSQTGTVTVETLIEEYPSPVPAPQVWQVERPASGVRLSNMVEVFNEANYPFWALKRAAEGRLRIRVAVDTTGRPVDCSVLEPSGDLDLDQPTCALVMEQARFSPARDRRGRPIAGIWTNRIVWQLENRAPWPVRNQVQRAVITVDPAGHRQCQIMFAVTDDDDPRACREYLIAPPIVAMIAATLSARAGRRDSWELVIENSQFVPGGPPGQSEGELVGKGPGEKLIGRARTRLTIAADGSVTRCQPLEAGGASDVEIRDYCGNNIRLNFAPSANGQPQSIVLVAAEYLKDR